MTKTRRVPVLAVTVAIATGLTAWASFLSHALLNGLWPNESLHSGLEMLGALATIAMGFALLQRMRESHIERFYFPALGIFGMGVFKGFHAVCSPGQSFVFLHSAAGLVGGIGLVLIWLPESLRPNVRNFRQVKIVFAASILGGAAALVFPEMLPQMVRNGQFTPMALAINVIAGLLFLVSAVRFWWNFSRTGDLVDYLFLCLALLLGLAGLVFWRSSLWDVEWWLWHGLQLLAFIVILGYVVQVQRRESAERRHAEEALHDSEGRFRKLFEHAPMGIGVSNLKGSVLAFNDRNLQMLGYTQDEMKRIDLRERYVEPDDRVKLLKILQTDGVVRDFETAIERKDGAVFQASITAATIEYAGEDALLTMITDISDRKLAEEEKLSLERQILRSQKLESLGILAGGIAHDFNNLLSSILGNTDLALESLPDMAPARPFLEEVDEATKRASVLTQQMLAYSGKGRFIVAPLDLSEMVREIVKLLKSAISKKAKLNVNLEANLPAIKADAAQIQQIVMNLMANASEAIGEKESGVINVTTGIRDCSRAYLEASCIDKKPAEGKYVFLEVSDTGSGMNEATRGKLFDPFFTTKFTGRGLGLSAVLGIVSGHSGAIMVESEVEKGSTFRVMFPALDEPVAKPEAIVDVKKRDDWQGTGTVLVVDDDPAIRRISTRMLKRLGFETLEAVDGQDGVEVFEKNAADIVCVLLDLTMPKRDGGEAFLMMQEIRDDVPVVLSSGFDETELSERFDGYGMAGFIHKPYRLANLRKTLRSVFESLE